MRKLLVIGMLVFVPLLQGCAGVARSYDDRLNVHDQDLDMDMRQLADDWDSFWLMDRQSRLTRWYTR